MTPLLPKSFRSIFLFTILIQSPALLADQIKVEEAHGTGVSNSEMQATTELVRTAVTDLGHHLVESGEDYTLHPALFRLGKALVLAIRKMHNDHLIYSTQLKASSIEELDKVASRVTEAVIAGRMAPRDPKVGELTHEESHSGAERRPTRKEWYLGFGGAGLSHLRAQGVAYNIAGAFNWDLNDVLLQILGDLSFRGDALFTSVGLGAHYFFAPGDIAPFLAADFSYGYSKVDGGGVFEGQSNSGFVVGLGSGIHFLHTASTSLEVGARFGLMLANNNDGHPGIIALRLGLYF